jgi:DNA mismatch repair protein MutS
MPEVSANTPMMRQYFQAKAQVPEALLAMRVGDFYEFYGEDAEIAARELDIVLTARSDGKESKLPMAGVPYHAVERYVARLLSKGHKVALCDQVEDPKKAKGLVRRKVTRVVTPGTVLEDSMLDASSNNYLAAAVPGPELFGLSYVDVSTAQFLATEIQGKLALERALAELARLSPAEVLLPQEYPDLAAAAGNACGAAVTPLDATPSVGSSRSMLQEQFEVGTLAGFGMEEYTNGVRAAASVLGYLKRNEVATASHLRSIATYSVDSFMRLDTTARRHLELTQNLTDGGRKMTLLSVIDATATTMGARLLKRHITEPLKDTEGLNRRLGAVEGLRHNHLLRDELAGLLSKVQDLERLTSRAAAGVAGPRDLAGLRDSLALIPAIRSALGREESPAVRGLTERLSPLTGTQELLTRALVEEPPALLKDGGVIRPGFSEELDRLRENRATARQYIATLESKEREATGIGSLKVGYNSVFGYHIEVSKPNLSRVPDRYIRKQTTASGERYITAELKEYEAAVLGAEERMTDLEADLFARVRAEVAASAPSILATAGAVAELDVMASHAETAARYGYVRPQLHDGDELEIEDGRHPVVEAQQVGTRFVPNDTRLSDTSSMIILTGPNMSGKSTYLRQTALIALLAQIGSFVPAAKARIPIFDRIFTRVGARDELASGQSTFMVEMAEAANILHHATSRSLVILDEIGRGTSTYDGLALAWAIAEYLASVGAKTLFATHYHHLNDLAETVEGVRNFRVAVKEDRERVVFLHKVLEGGTDRSYGLQVARMAGVPKGVLSRAAEVLAELEKSEAPLAQTGPQPMQLRLFEAEAPEILKELQGIDPAEMTPIEALTKLDEWKRRFGL